MFVFSYKDWIREKTQRTLLNILVYLNLKIIETYDNLTLKSARGKVRYTSIFQDYDSWKNRILKIDRETQQNILYISSNTCDKLQLSRDFTRAYK